jgi:hypothetical protein
LIRPNDLLPALLAIGVAVPAGDGGARRDRLTQISQRLAAGDPAAIDDLLACTQPVSTKDAPSEAEIERLRQDVARLRAASSATPATVEPLPAPPGEVGRSLREARAWLRAGEPEKCLKALSAVAAADAHLDGEVAYCRASALEQLGRDAEALEQYRKAAETAESPVSKAAAASGVDHVDWRLRRAVDPEAKP